MILFFGQFFFNSLKESELKKTGLSALAF